MIKLKLKKDFFYDRKTIRTVLLSLSILVLIINVVVFVVTPAVTIIGIKRNILQTETKNKGLKIDLLKAEKKKKEFTLKLEKEKTKKDISTKSLKERSFVNVVNFEKTLQILLDSLKIDTINVQKSYVFEENKILKTKKMMTHYQLKGKGSKITEFFNLLENSKELIVVKDSELTLNKKDSDNIIADVTIGYYILEDGEEKGNKVIKTTTKDIKNIIYKYNQKKDIFKENIEKKKYHKKFNPLRGIKFQLSGIVTKNNISNALLYYTHNKNTTRLFVSSNELVKLDGVVYEIDVLDNSVIIKKGNTVLMKLKK